MIKLNTTYKVTIKMSEANANLFNQLVQSGVPFDDAQVQSGIPADEFTQYVFQDGALVFQGNANTNFLDMIDGNLSGDITNANTQQNLFDQLLGSNVENDWRVRLQLAKGSNYLYRDTTGGGANGILKPLVETNGVIFPYTPQISTVYGANYSTYELTHSNFRGYFYQNSYVDAITIQAQFTAQDTAEANYMLAAIHFFKSANKMFYGQDPNRGVPPPMLFLSGLGDYQFNEHPCLLQQFQYNLPNNVDYIRSYSGASAELGNNGTGTAYTGVGADVSSESRLNSSGLSFGATLNQFLTNAITNNAAPTYVPTQIDITLTLLPIQTRNQISSQYSTRGYANGDLLRGGFW